MKNIQFLRNSVFFTLQFILSIQLFGSNHNIPNGLMIECIREPKWTEINDNQPEYSWIVPSNAAMQTAYQIIVSSTKENIEKNIGDVWNSEKVKSSTSINVEHMGKQLNPNSTYFWKIKVWNQNNKETEYSNIQEFKTGNLLKNISTGNYYQIENIRPKDFQKKGDSNYFIDFGKDAFGTLSITYNSTSIDTLTIRLGEKLDKKEIAKKPGGTIRTSEIRLAVHPNQKTYTIKLKADKRNTKDGAVVLPDSFGVLMPFRYCEIENCKSELKQEDVIQKAYFNYFDDTESSFTSSDKILNEVWEMCKYSIKATTFAGVYIDGDRERIPYEADAYINQLGHYGVDREYAMAKKTIEWFMEKPTWPTEWLLFTALIMKEDYYYTGNTELIKKFYNQLKDKTLIELSREDGLISSASPNNTKEFKKKIKVTIRDIVDWPVSERDKYDMKEINTVVNCFFYENMKIMTEFATILNKNEDKVKFQELSEKVKQSINSKLFDSSKGIYIDGEESVHSSLHANMFALAFDIVPKENIKTVSEFVKSRGMACSVYGAQFLLDGLYNASEDLYALDLMRSKGVRSWYNMIKVGSTITLEAWDIKFKKNLDWNHAWGAAPANIIPRKLWGITPKTPAFEIVSIKPQLGDLESTSIVTPTIRGQIKASYKRIDNKNQKYTIELPGNTTGEFSIQNISTVKVSKNGSKISKNESFIQLTPGMNTIEISAN